MNEKKTIGQKVFCFSIIMTIFGLLLVPGQAVSSGLKNLNVGDTALPFELKGADGKETYTIESLKDSKIKCLVFWASWSSRSLSALDDLQGMYNRYKNEGLSILAINVERENITSQNLDQINAEINSRKLEYPVLIDEELLVFNYWGVVTLPTTILVNEAGTIEYILPGYPTSGFLDLEEAIQKALGIYVAPSKTMTWQEGFHPIKKALLHFGLAKRLCQKGFAQKAALEFEKAIAVDPKFPDPHLFLALNLIRSDRQNEAKAELLEVESLQPGRIETALLTAYLLASEGKTAEAKTTLRGNKPFMDTCTESPCKMQVQEKTGENGTGAELEEFITARLIDLEIEVKKKPPHLKPVNK